MRSYTRWTTRDGHQFTADWVGSSYRVVADVTTGTVSLTTPDGVAHELDGDTARMISVRLIEGAALADVDAIRRMHDADRHPEPCFYPGVLPCICPNADAR